LRGATVTLIGANLDVEPPSNCVVIAVSSTKELGKAVNDYAPHADVIVMAAAVADYRPEEVSEAKLKKVELGDRMHLSLVQNPDILKELSLSRRDGQVLVGFAAETEASREAILERGRAKIVRKGCDFLVVNAVDWDKGFGADDNAVIVVNASGDVVAESIGSKMSVANSILDVLNNPHI
jgi:phosphopantothenoylcysteine decarboxylase/phosphopantothenate--cysteine ligase